MPPEKKAMERLELSSTASRTIALSIELHHHKGTGRNRTSLARSTAWNSTTELLPQVYFHLTSSGLSNILSLVESGGSDNSISTRLRVLKVAEQRLPSRPRYLSVFPLYIPLPTFLFDVDIVTLYLLFVNLFRRKFL